MFNVKHCSRCKSNRNVVKKNRCTTKNVQHISPGSNEGDSFFCNRFDYLALDLVFLSTNIFKASNLCLWRIAGTFSFSFRFIFFFFFGTFHVKNVIFPSICKCECHIQQFPFRFFLSLHFMRRQLPNKRTPQPFIRIKWFGKIFI